MAFLALVGSCETYTLLASPGAGTRTAPPLMGPHPYSPKMGDNTLPRREQLNTYGGGGVVDSKAERAYPPFASFASTRGDYGQDVELLRDQFPQAVTEAQSEGGRAYPPFSPNFGDNTFARKEQLSTISGGASAYSKAERAYPPFATFASNRGDYGQDVELLRDQFPQEITEGQSESVSRTYDMTPTPWTIASRAVSNDHGPDVHLMRDHPIGA